MNEGRLRRRLKVGRGSRGVQLFDGQLPVGGIGRGLNLESELCMSRNQGLRNLCIHSFSIIDVLWL